MNLLAVLVTYNERGEIPTYLSKTLDGWLRQDLQGHSVDLVISDNISHKKFDKAMRKFCAENNHRDDLTLHYLKTREHYPIFNSINLAFTFLKDTKHYDYFSFGHDDDEMVDPNVITTMFSEFDLNPKAGIVAGMVDKDNADRLLPYLNDVGDGSPVRVKILDAINGHFFMFSRYWMEKYDFKYPDILLAYANETLLTFMCAAIDTEKILCRRVMLTNLNYMKRANKASRKKSGGPKKKGLGTHGWATYKNFRSLQSIFAPGTKVGLGFDCWRRFDDFRHKRHPNKYWYLPDPNCYDENENCKDKDALYDYIKANLFLPLEIVDYKAQMRGICDRVVERSMIE